MVDGGCWYVGNRVVAILTNVGCVDVIGGLAGCIDAVMAGEATSRDIAVIENCRYPARTLVTVVALIAGDYVVGRLAGCEDAIVAAYAAPRDGRMVHEQDRAPCSLGMAVGTNLGTGNMIDGFRSCLHGADRGVAAHTGRTRALKLGAGMTAITGHVGMCTVKLKPRAEMVERLLCRCSR